MKDEYIPLIAFGSVIAFMGVVVLSARPAVAAQVRLINAMADGIEQGKITHISSPMGMGMRQRANPRKKKSKHRKNPAVTPILF